MRVREHQGKALYLALFHEAKQRLPAVVLSASLVAPWERSLDVGHRVRDPLTREHDVVEPVQQRIRLLRKLEANVARVLRKRVAGEPVQRLALEHVVPTGNLISRRDAFVGGLKPIEDAVEALRSEDESELFGKFGVHGARQGGGLVCAPAPPQRTPGSGGGFGYATAVPHA